MKDTQPVIIPAISHEHISLIRTLFDTYEASQDSTICFQSFAEELDSLPGAYAGPSGILLLAMSGADPAGCIAVKPINNEVCEMKRLFVYPAHRGKKLGHQLVTAAIAFAKQTGYTTMQLDTLPSMEKAIALYKLLGFKEYQLANTKAEVHYMKLELEYV